MARRRVFQRAAARRTSWEGSQISLSLTTAVQAQGSLVSESVLETFPNPTIVRIRGEVNVAVTAAGAGGANSNCVMGIKLTTASAFAAGGASVESPFTEIGGDWIWWHSATMRNSAAFTTTDSDLDGGRFVRVPVDSKAMRKVGPNQVLIFVAHNVVSGSTQTLVVGGVIRVLLKA